MKINEKRVIFLKAMVSDIDNMLNQTEKLITHKDLKYFADRDFGNDNIDDYSYQQCILEAYDLLQLAKSICKAESVKYQ